MEQIANKLEAISKASQVLSEDATAVSRELETIRKKVAEETVLMEMVQQVFDARVQLDVGGTLFTTSLTTLKKVDDTMLSAMFSGKYKLEATKDGTYFIDRDGTNFRWILNYLRDPESINILQDKTILGEVLLEAKYYSIAPLVDVIEGKLGCRFKLRAHNLACHLSSTDLYSPSSAEFQPNLTVELLDHMVDLPNTCNSILVTAYEDFDEKQMGNLLADFVDKGGNVVLGLYSNCTGYCYPQGRFIAENYYPLVPDTEVRTVTPVTLGKVHIPEHPIMKDVKNISLGTDNRRLLTKVSPFGSVQRIADWSDGFPMVATRTDKQGMVTCVSFSLGVDGGQQDAIKMTRNALMLQRI